MHPGLHNLFVKRVLLLGILLGRPASADRMPDVEDVQPIPVERDFWRDVTEPHKAEIDDILVKAGAAIGRGEANFITEYDPTGEGRQKLYREVFGMLRYARRLAPDRLEVLKQLDDAVRYLRMAQGPIVPGQPETARILVNLSTALALRGQTTDAIDVLADAMPAAPAYYSNEYQLATFALAVAYDRDDQRSAAVEQLERLRAGLQEQWGLMVAAAIAAFRFSRAEDQQYYRALLLEATDNYADARTEWAIYAASHGPYARRALEHITAIDKRTVSGVSGGPGPTTVPFTPTFPYRRRQRHP